MIYNTEADLHTLLDSLTDGEHIKATWVYDGHTITVEGPIHKQGRRVGCYRYIRWHDGDINPTLTSIEVTRDEEVTATRDNEKALHALIDSLEDEGTITAEWRDGSGTTTVTGAVRVSGDSCWVLGYLSLTLRWDDRMLLPSLHSVTVRRTVVQRWERGGHE